MGVFTLFEETREQVIVQVNADDALTVARHPYVSSNMAYITVTRGKEHVFTVVRKDGTTWCFGSSTLLSDGVRKLRDTLLSFIREQHVFIDVRTELNPYAADFYRWNNMWYVDFAFADTRDTGRVYFPNASESPQSLVQNAFAAYNSGFANACENIVALPNENIGTIFHIEI